MGFNMKTRILFLFALSLLITLNAQENKLTGKWLMVKAETKNKVQEPYFVTELTKDGKIIVMDIDFGSWKYNKKKNTIITKSSINKKFNGTYSILILEKDKLILKKDSVTSYYIKIESTKIADANKSSQLEGKWKIKNNENLLQVLEFTLPDSYTYVEADNNSTETTNGNWIYNPDDKSLIIMGFSRKLKGKLNVVSISENKLVLEKEGEKIIAEKEKNGNDKIERLTFEEDDFPEREEIDASEFPWNDFDYMAEYLQNIKMLVYKYGKLLPKINTLKYSTIISKVKVDLNKPSVDLKNSFVENNDTSQYSEKYKGGLMGLYDNFFPQAEIAPYRKTGVETVTVPAGTFECSVFEGFDGFDKVKYWMINDKPGVYAKIIKEQIDPFGKLEYSIQELEKIIEK
jgi:hypothetical protein